MAERIEIHYTPKHGSWLNMAEIELSALNGQSLDRRIPDMAVFRGHIAAWENDRNNRQAKIQWQFSNAKARRKLKHLYPKLSSVYMVPGFPLLAFFAITLSNTQPILNKLVSAVFYAGG